jgi:hypothetical protein
MVGIGLLFIDYRKMIVFYRDYGRGLETERVLDVDADFLV